MGEAGIVGIITKPPLTSTTAMYGCNLGGAAAVGGLVESKWPPAHSGGTTPSPHMIVVHLTSTPHSIPHYQSRQIDVVGGGGGVKTRGWAGTIGEDRRVMCVWTLWTPVVIISPCFHTKTMVNAFTPLYWSLLHQRLGVCEIRLEVGDDRTPPPCVHKQHCCVLRGHSGLIQSDGQCLVETGR